MDIAGPILGGRRHEVLTAVVHLRYDSTFPTKYPVDTILYSNMCAMLDM